MRSGSIVLASLLAVVSFCLSGCAGEGSAPAPATTTTTTPEGPDISQVQDQIFKKKCAFSGCHNSGSHQENLDLSSAEISYAQLVNVVSACAGKLRVVPGDAAASYLLHKCGAGPEPCGTLMPQLLAPLTAAELQLVTDWIEGGARPAPAAASETSVSSTTSSTQE